MRFANERGTVILLITGTDFPAPEKTDPNAQTVSVLALVKEEPQTPAPGGH